MDSLTPASARSERDPTWLHITIDQLLVDAERLGGAYLDAILAAAHEVNEKAVWIDRAAARRIRGRFAKRRVRGAGDVLALVIGILTLGLIRPCGGCRRRREALNRKLPMGRWGRIKG